MELTVTLPKHIDTVAAFGPSERNLKILREALGVDIAAREGVVRLSGEDQTLHVAQSALGSIFEHARRGEALSRQEVMDIVARASWQGDASAEGPANGRRMEVFANGRPVRARSTNQQAYLDAIMANDLVFAVGPAGTGKTYLAVAAAISLLRAQRVKRAILVRPAVEAGEKLGYLPGDMQEKVNPYLRPLLDALGDMMDYQTLRGFMTSGVIEIAPLAFMRGRTLNSAVVILDEAQNTTRAQMQMFLTRMGQDAKMIVTGDTTQIDLPDAAESGLIDAVNRLEGVPGVGFAPLRTEDVVRHDLVQRIIDAYASTKGAGRDTEANNG